MISILYKHVAFRNTKQARLKETDSTILGLHLAQFFWGGNEKPRVKRERYYRDPGHHPLLRYSCMMTAAGSSGFVAKLFDDLAKAGTAAALEQDEDMVMCPSKGCEHMCPSKVQ